MSAIPHPNGQILMVVFGGGFSTFHEITYKGSDMKKKLLVLLIAVIPILMPNLATAMAIDLGAWRYASCQGWGIGC
jgi:hypothetical protein